MSLREFLNRLFCMGGEEDGGFENTERINKPIFSKKVLDEFRENVGCIHPETGGIIGCKEDLHQIDLFAFDKNSRNTGGSFEYDVAEMSAVYNEWRSKNYKAAGFVHSHPRGVTHPSFTDIATSLNLMRFFKNESFYLPIIQTSPDGLYRMYFYTVRDGEKYVELNLEYVIKAEKVGYTAVNVKAKPEKYSVYDLEKYLGIDKKEKPAEVKKEDIQVKRISVPESRDYSEYFVKMNGMFPDNVLEKVIVMVGVGGARSLVENLARHRFMNYILIDGDVVAPSNIATQGVFISEMGKTKVHAIKSRVLDINPEARVVCVDRFLDNSISDEDFKRILDKFPDKKPTDFLIFGCTDDHHAQHRCSLLALKYGIPYIGAAVYEKGYGAEIIFNYPGVTEGGCPRCMLKSRYEAYENGYKNDVTSAGCSNFVTERLNTTLGQIALMMLMYHEDENSPYSNMLDKVKNRTLVQIRLSPMIKEGLGIDIFDKYLGEGNAVSKYSFFDDTLWLTQHPDSAENGETPCKLCGGVTNLKELMGKWKDTRNA